MENINSNENEFIEYSYNAINTLDKFHEVSLIVYVENNDDAHFWGNIFQLCQVDFTYHFELCGGSKEVDKKIESIVNGALGEHILAIRDSDYLALQNKKIVHPRILYTYGYSIENCLFNHHSIVKLFLSNCRTKIAHEKFELILSKLYENIYNSLYKLWECDYISVNSEIGMEVMGDNCNKFLEKGNIELNFNKEKIESTIKSFTHQKRDRAIQQCHFEISLDNFPRWIRGHFLQSLFLVFIKQTGGIKSLPTDNLLSQAFGLLEYNIFKDPDRKQYYEEICQKIHVTQQA